MSQVRALLMRPEDDVAVLLADVEAGDSVDAGEAGAVVAVEAIPQGHKVAVHDIGAGQTVRKYGAAIGRATAAIQAGAHVHVHNLESRRLRGDE
jgi:altronate dehydratase small subunit